MGTIYQCALPFVEEEVAWKSHLATRMGHDLVNLNTYTQTPLDSRLEAVQTLEPSFVN